MRLSVVALMFSMLLGGCAAWTLVDNQRQSIAGRFSVDPQLNWSRLRQPGVELWTVDGPALQALRFFDPIEDGETLFPAQSKDGLPRYSSRMSESEVQEFVVHSVQRSGGTAARARGLRPWRMGSLHGFRFELDFLGESGLEMSALLAGAIDGGKLYLIAYTGARAHYFPRYAAQVERLLASVQSTGS